MDAAANQLLEAGCGDGQNIFTLLSTRYYGTCDWVLGYYLQTPSRRLPCGDYMPMSEELGRSPMSPKESNKNEGEVLKKDEHVRVETKAYR